MLKVKKIKQLSCKVVSCMYKKTNAMFRLGSLSDDDYDDSENIAKK